MGWYVLRTEARSEYLCATELERDGFEVYLPCIKTLHPRLGHPDAPLFPSYLFLKCDPDLDGWPFFFPRHRVSSWVRFGGDIPSLPDTAMTALMERVETINRQGGVWRRPLSFRNQHVSHDRRFRFSRKPCGHVWRRTPRVCGFAACQRHDVSREQR